MRESSNGSTIIVNGVEAEILESGGRYFFSILLDDRSIPRYRRMVLENLCCHSLLPMHFVHQNGKLRAYYDFGGFVQLKEIFGYWKGSGKYMALETAETLSAVLACVLSAENYLFCAGDFFINSHTIFIRPGNGEVKLAYIPDTENTVPPSIKFTDLVLKTAELCCDEQWSVYANEIWRRIRECNESMIGIQKIMQEKGREIYAGTWPEKEVLRFGAVSDK